MLKVYKVMVNGFEMTMQLDDEDAKKRGVFKASKTTEVATAAVTVTPETPKATEETEVTPEDKAPEEKAAEAPKNKQARAPRNRSVKPADTK
jgi:hypothetical protein